MPTLNVVPRQWQVNALNEWKSKFRGIVQAVTGSGKTTFALLCVEEFLRHDPQGKVYIIVPTQALLDQWYVTLREDFGVEADQISFLGGGNKPNLSRQFIIAVINSARKFSEEFAAKFPTFLIVDECHRAGSQMNSHALSGAFAATLGLSATPERQYDDGYKQFLEPYLGHCIYSYTYADAYKDGVIVPFKLFNAKFKMSAVESREYDLISKRIATLMSKGLTDADDQIKALKLKRSRVTWNSFMRVPLTTKLALDHRGDRQIIFHESVEKSTEILNLLLDKGVRATIYHAGLTGVVRRENLRLFKRGYYSVLVCCRALDEGLNVPETTIAIIACSTSSDRQRIQRLGRVLRHSKGKDSATIYTLYATEPEFERLSEEAATIGEMAKVTWLEVKVNFG